MEIIVISLVLLVLGALFVIPRSNGRGILELYKGGINPQYKEGLLDLWIIINDKVYDVTPYVDEHPGGDAILNNVGDDSTEGFSGQVSGWGSAAIPRHQRLLTVWACGLLMLLKIPGSATECHAL